MKARCGLFCSSGIGDRDFEHPPFGAYTSTSVELSPPAKNATIKIKMMI